MGPEPMLHAATQTLEPCSEVLPFQRCWSTNMRSCPAPFWEGLHGKFCEQGAKVRLRPSRNLGQDFALDPTQIWTHVVLHLDLRSLAMLGRAANEFALLFLSEGAAALLRSRLGAEGLGGCASSIFRLGHTLEALQCNFVSAWDGQAGAANIGALLKAKKRFPEARQFLWQTSFPPDAFDSLTAPLAAVDAAPAATIRIGTTTLKMSLRLMCVSERFFDEARPLHRLLAHLELEVDHGPVLYKGGMPGPEGHTLCGDGHRWAIVCQSAEDSASVPIFCSLRESFLQPSWRHPQLLARSGRAILDRCEPIDGESLGTHLGMPFRLLLSIYRTEDDEPPDEPER